MPVFVRDQSEIEAVKKLLKLGAKFIAPDGSQLSEAVALAKLEMQYPEMQVGGLLKQAPDNRDIFVSALPPTKIKSVDLTKPNVPIWNQGRLGGCYAFATTRAMDLVDDKDGSFSDRSRLYTFYKGHELEGTLGTDSGCTIRGAFKALNKWGACDESMWPYVVEKCWQKPTAAMDVNAALHKISEYKFLKQGDVEQLKSTLALGYPVVAGMYVYSSLMSAQICLDGILKMPGKDEKDQGAHAITFVGFKEDARGNYLKVANSWGPAFADHGNFWMQYSYYGQFCFDAGVITKLSYND